MTTGMKARQNLLKTVHIDYLSSVDDTRYTGNFTLKKMNIKDLAALGVRKGQLNGGMYYDESNPGRGLDENTDNFNNMIAHLELCIKEAPPWWNLDEITDVHLVGKLFQEVMAFENSFLSRQSDRANTDGHGEGSSQTTVQETNTAGNVSQVVGAQVQAALEP